LLRFPQVDAPRLRLGQVRLHREVGAREVEGGLEVFGGGHGRKTRQSSTTAKNPSIQEDGRGPDPVWRAVGYNRPSDPRTGRSVTMRRRAALLMLLLVVLPWLGCSGGKECDRCSSDSDCKSDFVCTTF